MSIFGEFMGTLFGSTSKYSRNQKSLSRDKLYQLISENRITTLTKDEAILVRDVIDKARRGDAYISMFQIEEELTHLKNSKKISESDYRGLMKIFYEYFGK